MRVNTAMLSANPVPFHPHLALDLTLLLSPIPKASSRQAKTMISHPSTHTHFHRKLYIRYPTSNSMQLFHTKIVIVN